MTRRPPLRAGGLAVGYDLAVAVDPDIYRITYDADEVAYAFRMDAEAREHVAEAARAAFEDTGGPYNPAEDVDPRAVEELEVTSGYIRVRYVPPGRDAAHPRDLLDALRTVPDRYNEAHAQAPELDGFALDAERTYLGTFIPEDGPDRETFIDDHARGDTVPESDGPVFTVDREAATLDDNRRFAYEFVIPFDAGAMYDPREPSAIHHGEHAVEWDRPEVREVLGLVIDRKPPLWPDRPENTPHVEIHPGYVSVRHYTPKPANPVARAETVRNALLTYNRYRNPDPRGHPQDDRRHPPLAFKQTAYIRALDHGRTADDWIAEHGLDAVDGEPTDPEPADVEEADADRKLWDRVIGRS